MTHSTISSSHYAKGANTDFVKKSDCPPLSQIKAPGDIFQKSKGTPAFFNHFQTLYTDFRKLLGSGTDSHPNGNNEQNNFKEAGQEILKLTRKMFLYYKVQLHLEEKDDYIHEILAFLKVMIEVVYSYPREDFIKLRLSDVFVYLDQNSATANKDFYIHQDCSFIIRAFRSNEDIVRKLQDLLKNSLIKATDEVLKQWQIFEHNSNLDVSPETVSKRSRASSVSSPIYSCLKKNNSVTNIAPIALKGMRKRIISTDLLTDDGSDRRGRKKSDSRVYFGNVSYNQVSNSNNKSPKRRS